MRSFYPRRQAGFTLPEMMVAIALIAIISAMAIVGAKSLTDGQRARNASYELLSSLSLARSEAIKRGVDVTITPVSTTSWQSGWTITGGGVTVKSQGSLDGVFITTSATSVTYKNTGRLPTTVTSFPSFQIDLSETATSYVRCVTIDLSGAPRAKTGVCS